MEEEFIDFSASCSALLEKIQNFYTIYKSYFSRPNFILSYISKS